MLPTGASGKSSVRWRVFSTHGSNPLHSDPAPWKPYMSCQHSFYRSKDHRNALVRRMGSWTKREFKKLFEEVEAIQSWWPADNGKRYMAATSRKLKEGNYVRDDITDNSLEALMAFWVLLNKNPWTQADRSWRSSLKNRSKIRDEHHERRCCQCLIESTNMWMERRQRSSNLHHEGAPLNRAVRSCSLRWCYFCPIVSTGKFSSTKYLFRVPQ